jgi:hypothetical protein
VIVARSKTGVVEAVRDESSRIVPVRARTPWLVEGAARAHWTCGFMGQEQKPCPGQPLHRRVRRYEGARVRGYEVRGCATAGRRGPRRPKGRQGDPPPARVNAEGDATLTEMWLPRTIAVESHDRPPQSRDDQQGPDDAGKWNHTGLDTANAFCNPQASLPSMGLSKRRRKCQRLAGQLGPRPGLGRGGRSGGTEL